MAKGGAFENEVCKLLSLWWTNGQNDDIFCRSRASGAWFTSRGKSGKTTENQAGDIMANTNEGRKFLNIFHVECKTGYGRKNKKEIVRWDILDLLDSEQKEPIFIKMWIQAVRDSGIGNKSPLLIFRRNRRTICIAFRTSIHDKLLVKGVYLSSQLRLHVKIPLSLNLTILSLKDFFDWLDTKERKKIFLEWMK